MNEQREYQIIDLAKEYPGLVGNMKWAIVSDRSEEELLSEYEEVVMLSPYVLLNLEQWNAMREYYKNDDKCIKRSCRYHELRELTKRDHKPSHHSFDDPTLDEIIKRDELDQLKKIMQRLTKTQRKRLTMYFFLGHTMREIARSEMCDYRAIYQSIDGSIKKIKNIFEKASSKGLSQSYIVEGQIPAHSYIPSNSRDLFLSRSLTIE